MEAWQKRRASRWDRTTFALTFDDLLQLLLTIHLPCYLSQTLFPQCFYNDTPAVTCRCVSVIQWWVTICSQTPHSPDWKYDPPLHRLKQPVTFLSLFQAGSVPLHSKHVFTLSTTSQLYVGHETITEGFSTLLFLIFISRDFANPVCPDCFLFIIIFPIPLLWFVLVYLKKFWTGLDLDNKLLRSFIWPRNFPLQRL